MLTFTHHPNSNTQRERDTHTHPHSTHAIQKHCLKRYIDCMRVYFILQLFHLHFKMLQRHFLGERVSKRIFLIAAQLFYERAHTFQNTHSRTYLQQNEIKLSLRESNFFHKLCSRTRWNWADAELYAYCMRLRQAFKAHFVPCAQSYG